MSTTTIIASTVASSTTGSASAKLSIGSTVYLTATINSTTTLDVTSTVSVISSTNYTTYETITFVVGNGLSAYTSTVVVSDVHLIAGTYTVKLHKFIYKSGDVSYPEWKGEATIPTRNTIASITPVGLTTTAAGISNALSYLLTFQNIAPATSTDKAKLVGDFSSKVTSAPKSTTVMPSTTDTHVTTTYIINSTSTYSKVISVNSVTSTVFPNSVTAGLQWFFQYTFTDSTGWVITFPVRTYYVTSSYNSSYRFTVLVNDKKLDAPFNITCERSIYSAGELDFALTPHDMITSTVNNTTTYSINKGDKVTFWYLGNLVFTGTIENIKKKNTNEYDLTAYDKLYYLTAVRKDISLGNNNRSSTVNFGTMISNIFASTSTAFSLPTSTYEGFGYKLNNTISPYFSLMQLSNLLGYKFGTTLTNSVVLSPIYSTTTTVLKENNNNWIPRKKNDVNYGYNQIYVTANDYTSTNASKLTTSVATAASITGQITSKSLVYNWLYLAGIEWSNLITSTGGVSPSSPLGFASTLAKQGLVILGNNNQQGFLSASTWFNLKSLNVSGAGFTQQSLLNLGYPNRFTIVFSDNTEWHNLFLSKYTITSSGLMLTLVNMHQDLWSLMNTVTATNS